MRAYQLNKITGVRQLERELLHQHHVQTTKHSSFEFAK